MTNANELFKLRNQIRYCAESGNFYWMKTVYDPVDGSFHGVVDADAKPIKAYRSTNGYLYIKAGGKKHLAHRLAWVLSTGHWPKQQLDHINGNCEDNRLCNLRECTVGENAQNHTLRKDSTTGFIGVCFNKTAQKYMAYINKDGRRHNLGYYSTPEAAHVAYLEAKAGLHTFNPIPREAA